MAALSRAVRQEQQCKNCLPRTPLLASPTDTTFAAPEMLKNAFEGKGLPTNTDRQTNTEATPTLKRLDKRQKHGKIFVWIVISYGGREKN